VLWLCTDCSAAYAVGQSACPNCGSTAYLEDHPMPKITVHGGATNEHDPETPDELVTAEPEATEEDPCPGTTSETSSSKPSSSPKTSGSAARSRARTTESPS